jgi:hypothetical protein
MCCQITQLRTPTHEEIINTKSKVDSTQLYPKKWM